MFLFVLVLGIGTPYCKRMGRVRLLAHKRKENDKVEAESRHLISNIVGLCDYHIHVHKYLHSINGYKSPFCFIFLILL